VRSLRIVLAMIEPPLPFGNAAARWYYVLLRGLVERGHRVTAFAACSAAKDIPKAQALFPRPRYDLRCYSFPQRYGIRAKIETLRRPYSYMFSPEFVRDLKAAVASGADILHLEQLWSGWVGFGLSIPTLMSVLNLQTIDLGCDVPKTWRDRLNRKMMFRAERCLLRSSKWISACTPRLVPAIQKINPAARVTPVPLGIEPALYHYISERDRVRDPVVTLIGSMCWYPGFSAARRLLRNLYPEIKRRNPRVRFEIVGWSARSALRDYLHLPDVQIYEDVPDPEPFFRRAGVFVYAPARGSGMKIKILEAMMLGVPVVTTSEGVEGLPAEDGMHAGISDTDEGIVDRIVALLDDRKLQERQRVAARRLMESWCSPRTTVNMIEQIYARMLMA
jgi:glycosyltransferase involved in cell wall biosynthesis